MINQLIKHIVICLIILYVPTISFSQSFGEHIQTAYCKCLTGDCQNGVGSCYYKYLKGTFTGSFENGYGVKGVYTCDGFSVLRHYWNGTCDPYTGFDKNEVLIFYTKSIAGLKKCNSCITKSTIDYTDTYTTEYSTHHANTSNSYNVYSSETRFANNTKQNIYLKRIEKVYSKVQKKYVYTDCSIVLFPGEYIQDKYLCFVNFEEADRTQESGIMLLGAYIGEPIVVPSINNTYQVNNSSIPNNKTSQTPNNQSSSKASDVNSIANIRPGEYNTLIYNQLRKLIINGHDYDSFTKDDLKQMANDKELIKYYEYLLEISATMWLGRVPDPLNNAAEARLKGLVPKSYWQNGDNYITFGLDIRGIARDIDINSYKTIPLNKHYNGIWDLQDYIVNKRLLGEIKLKQGKNYNDFLRE